MKASDALVKALETVGVSLAFGVQGGAVVHIFDSLETSSINVTYSIYEQSAALAAVAASRVTRRPQLCVVTTGPGGTNALTGLLAAWQDSVATIFISGQTRLAHTSYGTRRRQVGSQEAPILDLVRPITKAAMFVNDPANVVSSLFQAYEIAVSGRQGPVWLDIPVDVQWSQVTNQDFGLPTDSRQGQMKTDPQVLAQVRKHLGSAAYPLIWLGGGSRDAYPEISKLIDSWQIPFVTTWQAKHFLGPNQGFDLGTVGPFGQRGANAAVYECDLLLAIGSHLGYNHTTGNAAQFCPNATKVVVGIDPVELESLNVTVQQVVQADASEFVKELLKIPPKKNLWSAADFKRLQSQNLVDSQRDSLVSSANPNVNSNVFFADLFGQDMLSYDVVIDGGGTALYAGWQCTYGQGIKHFAGSTAISSMGTALAEAVGVQLASESSKTFVTIGDGSFWMSLQDLPPLGQLGRPVVVLIVNNGGYLAIRHTQKEFLGGRYFGTSSEGGLPFPEIEPVVRGLGFKYLRIDGESANHGIEVACSHSEGVLVLELMCSDDQPLLFSQVFAENGDGTKSALPLSTMAP